MSGWLRRVVVSSVILSGAVLQGQSAIRSLDKGAQSNVDDRLTASARTAAEWTTLWKKHNVDKPLPRVDFSKEMVVAVFMGSRPTAGFSVEIVAAVERDGKLVVSYKEAQPAPGGITAQVLTAPYHIAAVAKSSLPVTFEPQS
jgi:PrcB C-terminal